MLFKNAFHLLIDNFSLNYKFLLYKIIISVVCVGLAAVLIVPNVAFIFSSEEFSSLVVLIKDFLRALVSGNTEFLNGFPSEFSSGIAALGRLISAETGRLVFVVVSAVVVLLLFRFLSGMGNFVLGGLIDDNMSSYAKTPFSSAYIKNLGKAALWQVIYVPVTFVYDAAVLALCYVFFLILLNIISFAVVATAAALMLSVALFLVSQAVKLTVFNSMVPALVSDQCKLSVAFRKGFSQCRGNFGTLFSTYLVTCLLILCLGVGGAFCSFGAALLLVVPMSFVMLVCIQFVSYYTFEKKKYFLAEDKIVKPKEAKEQENFYDDFEL